VIISAVHQALAHRHPNNRSDGRPGFPAEVVLRLLILKRVCNWSYAVLEHKVSATTQGIFGSSPEPGISRRIRPFECWQRRRGTGIGDDRAGGRARQQHDSGEPIWSTRANLCPSTARIRSASRRTTMPVCGLRAATAPPRPSFCRTRSSGFDRLLLRGGQHWQCLAADKHRNAACYTRLTCDQSSLLRSPTHGIA
jgi:hypothetical protein